MKKMSRPLHPFLSALVFIAFAGCAEVQQTGQSINVWLRNYAWGGYHATLEQTHLAHARASRHYEHLSATKKKEMRESGSRYLAVRTLDPTPKQLAEIKKKSATAYAPAPASYGGLRRHAASPPPSSTAPSGPWHCVMIWDTWAKQVVGNDCYAVTEMPPVGQTARFDTYSAEYIGSGE